MIQKLKDAWVEALRSGEYDQGTDRLRSDSYYETGASEFCCLGVLCDVIDPEGWVDIGEYPVYVTEIDGERVEMDVQLDSKAMHYLGITEADQNRLVSMNDDTRDDFDAIARWIEDNL